MIIINNNIDSNGKIGKNQVLIEKVFIKVMLLMLFKLSVFFNVSGI